jgi:heterodisulfide reductase subunit A
MKLRPVDFAKQGVFMAGLAHWPKFVEESIAQASGAAARAMTVISKDFMESIANISIVDQAKCRGCGRCEAICEFAAASVQEVSPGVFKTTINPALCKGCGACAVVCCNGAITCLNFTDKQILAMVDTCLEEAVK